MCITRHFPMTEKERTPISYLTDPFIFDRVVIKLLIILFIYLQTDDLDEKLSLNLDNVVWANSIIASGTALGVVIYTGYETRSVMNTSQPSSKVRLWAIIW